MRTNLLVVLALGLAIAFPATFLACDSGDDGATDGGGGGGDEDGGGGGGGGDGGGGGEDGGGTGGGPAFRCSMKPEVGTGCYEFPASDPADYLADAETDCDPNFSVWEEGNCPADGALGQCWTDGGKKFEYCMPDGTTPEDQRRTWCKTGCENYGGTYTEM